MPTSVILSIRPEYVERIFNGSKQFEFRRRIFENRQISTVLIYATAPIGKVVGEFEIEEILELEPERLWEHTRDLSGIAKERFDEYFEGTAIGYALRIGKRVEYEEPRDLDKHFNVKRPPQSFMYLPISQ